MKVLEVIQDNRLGGIAVRAVAVASALRQHGVESVFVLPTDDGDVSRRCRSLGFGVIRLTLRKPNLHRPVQTLLWFLSFPLSVRQLSGVIRRENPDAIHANGMICLQAVMAGLLTEVPVLWHLAGTTIYPKTLSRIVLKILGRKAYKVFIADGVRKYFMGDAPFSAREMILHEPIDIDQVERAKACHIRGHFRRQIGIPEDAILVCTVANVTSLKGIDVLLEAAVQVRRKHPGVHFVVVGKKLSTQQRFIRRLERAIMASEMSSRFILVGYRDDIHSLLLDCDLFVLPSLSEGTPLSILEAMAAGVPVIATRVGGIPEQIEHAKSGILVHPGDADNLAAAIENLVAQSELRVHLAHRAQSRVREEFSLGAFVPKFLDLLRRCRITRQNGGARAIS